MLSGVGASWLGNLGQLMGVLAVFFAVLLLTWLVTRWLAGYQREQIHGQNLKVIETLRLTVNSYIQIIEAGEVYLVIAVNKDRIVKLAELDKDQLTLKADGMAGTKIDAGMDFNKIFEKVKRHLPKK